MDTAKESADAVEWLTQTTFGHRTAPKKTRNPNVLNQDMVHPFDRASRRSRLSDLQPANLDDFAFRLTEPELDERFPKRKAGSA